MDEKHTQAQATEEHILRRIVNAMLAAEHELRDASTGEWAQHLRASCRLQRMAFDGDTCA